MKGTTGKGPQQMNFTGRSVSVLFQRAMKASVLLNGRVRPMRPLSAFWSELSFLNWPLLSAYEPAME
jgi:hypothetical protein